MAGAKSPCARIVKVYRDEFIEMAQKQKQHGVFGLDDLCEGRAREFKLNELRESLEKYDRGWEGNSRACPKCGKKQLYKGDAPRVLKFDCGEIELKRAYYVCPDCKQSTFPLDETLNLSTEMEQGRLREKMSMLGALVPYHQAPEVTRILLGIELAGPSVRRALLREAELVEKECPKRELEPDKETTLYIEMDGLMCPTREERKDAEDQGYREAKIVQAFLSKDCVEVSKERVEILDQLLEAKICTAEKFRPIVKNLFKRCHTEKAKQVVFLADGAKWIWNLCRSIDPNAIQILDYAHAKQHLFSAVKILYGEESELTQASVKRLEGLLFEDKVEEVIAWFKIHEGHYPEFDRELGYFSRNKKRMLYKTFREMGLIIGSGAVESSAKRIAHARIKGSGMRWNIKDVNPVLMFRAALFEHRIQNHWRYQRVLEAQYFQKLAA
jgi:hypothetical protein